MKKVFVSVPIRGRNNTDVMNSITKMHELAEFIFGEELELIHGYWIYPSAKGNHSLYRLGQAIIKMAEADYFIGIGYSDYFIGCNEEYGIAQRYGIPTYSVDISKVKFLKDAYDTERRHWNNPPEVQINN